MVPMINMDGHWCDYTILHHMILNAVSLISLIRLGWTLPKRSAGRLKVSGKPLFSCSFPTCVEYRFTMMSTASFCFPQGANYNFTFNVKFYPPDPAHLSEDITRYCFSNP